MNKKNPHWGSTLDDFLREEGVRDATRAEAIARVVAWQLRAGDEAEGHVQDADGRADAHKPPAG
jgi:hypothetical protein